MEVVGDWERNESVIRVKNKGVHRPGHSGNVLTQQHTLWINNITYPKTMNYPK